MIAAYTVGCCEQHAAGIAKTSSAAFTTCLQGRPDLNCAAVDCALVVRTDDGGASTDPSARPTVKCVPQAAGSQTVYSECRTSLGTK